MTSSHNDESETQDDEAENEEFEAENVELSLDQLSQAYAQVMREQGTLPDPLDGDESIESGDDDADDFDEADQDGEDDDAIAAPRTPARKAKTLDQIDAEDNAGCSISPASIVESLLFVGAPDGVKLTARILASVMRDVSPKEIASVVKSLNEGYEQTNSPYRIELNDKCYEMKLQGDMGELQNHFFGRNRPAKLSQNAIDVLAVVAYNQPVTRAQVDKIRSRPSGSALNQLVKRELIETIVREDSKKETTYKTAAPFLELFGLGELDDLPQTSIASDLEELSDF